MLDLFGYAVLKKSEGRDEKFYFKFGNQVEEHDLNKYFRSYDELTSIEKKIIDLSYGSILDVGCGTGIYEPYLIKKGDVLGIDISDYMIKVSKNNGITCTKKMNIFEIDINNKYDTILFIENNLGMVGNINKLRDLIVLLDIILKPTGQIITNIPKGIKGIIVTKLMPIYEGKEGQEFEWLHLSPSVISIEFGKCNFESEILEENESEFLVRITKS